MRVGLKTLLTENPYAVIIQINIIPPKYEGKSEMLKSKGMSISCLAKKCNFLSEDLFCHAKCLGFLKN